MKLLMLLTILSCFGDKAENRQDVFSAVERGDRSYITSLTKNTFVNQQNILGDTPLKISLKQYLGKDKGAKSRGVENILIPILVEMANKGILKDIGGVLIDGAEDVFHLDEDGLISTFLKISLDVGLLVFTMLNSPRRGDKKIVLEQSDIDIIKNIKENKITIIKNDINIQNTFINKAKKEIKTNIHKVDTFKHLDVNTIKDNKDDFIKTFTDKVTEYISIKDGHNDILAKILNIGMKILKEIK